LWYSRDGGATWRRFTAGFPTVPIYDVKFVQRSHDLVVATHGRGLFVLDNITPLEELTPDVVAADLHVFSTLPAQIRVRARRPGIAPTRFTTPSAPSGAMIDYFLKVGLDTSAGRAEGQPAGGPRPGGFRRRPGVKVTVTDSHGDTVVVDSGAPGRQGVNRFVWGLRYAGPTRIDFERGPGQEEENPFRNLGGPRVVPGTYTVAVTAAGKTETRTVTVEPDPVLGGDSAGFLGQLRAALQLRNETSALNTVLNRLTSLQTQIQNAEQALRGAGEGRGSAGPVFDQARALDRKLKDLKDSLYNSDMQRGGQDDVHYLGRFQDRYQGLSFGSGFGYAQPPAEPVMEEWKVLRSELDAYLARFNEILKTDVAQFNQTAQANGAPTLVGGEPVQIQPLPLR
jgi:hypothetical protein